VLLSPFIPDSAAKLWSAIGGAGDVQQQNVRAAFDWTGGPLVTPLESSLFPRIEQVEAGTSA
jgi:methionyl-tRNA synthetase